MDINLSKYEVLLAALFFAACFIFIHPDLFFGISSPMGGDTWTLKDPTVSWSAFMPAFREFKYELFTHGNVLWSNLRGLGQPLLGNTVQGAPLFPLNLVLMPLSDSLYWSVMPISRIILITLGLYVIARHVFRLPIIASLLFALFAGFNINVFRWLNHPWSNGLLAGIWYFYFLCRLTISDKYQKTGLQCLGLIISVFAMCNAGFPEASLLSTIIVVFLFVGFLGVYWGQIDLRRAAILIVICHLIGFFLSAGPLIALLEFIHYSEAMSLRSGFGSGHYELKEFIPYALSQFSFFWPSAKQQEYLAFNVGLFGLFFAIHGVLSLFVLRASPAYRVQLYFAIAFIASMSIFVIKIFGLSDIVNIIFAKTPILAQSHIHTYFSPMFYLGLAYFSSLGIQEVFTNHQKNKTHQSINLIISVVASITILSLFAIATKYFNGTAPEVFWYRQLGEHAALHVQLFAIFSVCFCLFQASMVLSSRINLQSRTTLNVNRACCSILVVLVVLEINSTLPDNFIAKDKYLIQHSEDTQASIAKAINSAPLNRHELRGRSADAEFVGLGLATVDNGVSAILPADLRRLRKSLFITKFGGYIQLGEPKRPWSWNSLSSNVHIVHTTPKSHPNWSEYKADPEMMAHVMDWDNSPKPLTKPVYFEGVSWALVPEKAPVSVWLKFQTDITNFWVKASYISHYNRGVRRGLHRRITKWRVRVAAEWITDTKIEITVRQVNEASKTYHDALPVTLSFDQHAPASLLSQNTKLIGTNKDLSYLVYFNEDALPRAYIASKCHFFTSQNDEMSYYTQSDAVARGEVLLNTDEGWSEDFCTNYKEKLARVPITQDNGKSLKLDTIQGPGILVINDSFYPGWRAKDLNQNIELPIKHANTALRAIYLPEDRQYLLRLSYRPDWLTIVYVLLFAAGILSVVLRIYLKQDRQHT